MSDLQSAIFRKLCQGPLTIRGLCLALLEPMGAIQEACDALHRQGLIYKEGEDHPIFTIS